MINLILETSKLEHFFYLCNTGDRYWYTLTCVNFGAGNFQCHGVEGHSEEKFCYKIEESLLEFEKKDRLQGNIPESLLCTLFTKNVNFW